MPKCSYYSGRGAVARWHGETCEEKDAWELEEWNPWFFVLEGTPGSRWTSYYSSKVSNHFSTHGSQNLFSESGSHCRRHSATICPILISPSHNCSSPIPSPPGDSDGIISHKDSPALWSLNQAHDQVQPVRASQTST